MYFISLEVCKNNSDFHNIIRVLQNKEQGLWLSVVSNFIRYDVYFQRLIRIYLQNHLLCSMIMYEITIRINSVLKFSPGFAKPCTIQATIPPPHTHFGQELSPSLTCCCVSFKLKKTVTFYDTELESDL